MGASEPTEVPAGAPEERVDALYGLPLGEFTPARDALAKELRAGGERSAATWVRGLRKPSAAAWVVNQLARTQGPEAKRLLDAGERLRRAQGRVLSQEGSADELREATERAAEAQDELLAKAAGLLDDRGHGPSEATIERTRETLQAALADEDVGRLFAAGRLTREHRATGFGLGPGATPSPAGRPSRGGRRRARAGSDGRGSEEPSTTREERAREREERARARDELKRAKAARREAGGAVSAAERDLAKARRDAERAQRRCDEATEALEKARAAEAETQERLRAAEAALERASAGR